MVLALGDICQSSHCSLWTKNKVESLHMEVEKWLDSKIIPAAWQILVLVQRAKQKPTPIATRRGPNFRPRTLPSETAQELPFAQERRRNCGIFESSEALSLGFLIGF